jgi:hypothetical protein
MSPSNLACPACGRTAVREVLTRTGLFPAWSCPGCNRTLALHRGRWVAAFLICFVGLMPWILRTVHARIEGGAWALVAILAAILPCLAVQLVLSKVVVGAAPGGRD